MPSWLSTLNTFMIKYASHVKYWNEKTKLG